MPKVKKIFYFIFLVITLLHYISFSLKADENKYFLTLKDEKVNVRQGPSFEYPIKFVYKKKYLPVIVLDSWENFKKIMDYNNNSGWIYIGKLSKKKAAINLKNNSFVFKKPTIYSKPVAKLKKGRLLLIKKCKNSWCKISTSNHIGWIKKEYLWGRI